MQSLKYKINCIGTLMLTVWLMIYSVNSNAHLMVAQHGTLNVVNDKVFMVLSLPLSAFNGIDLNFDGQISMIEFNQSRALVTQKLKQHISLSAQESKLPLEGLMLSPVMPHDTKVQSVTQLIVMAQFPMKKTDQNGLIFQMGLFGKQASEQNIKITATRSFDRQKLIFDLTPHSTTKGLSFY